MENNKLFKSFDYVVRNLFTYEDKVEVKVFFIYKELNVITKPLFIKKLNDKNNAYYLDEAKKITEKMINDGSLKKECEKKVIRKKLLPILIPIVSAMAIAGITVGCYYGLQTKAQEVNVDVPETNGLIFDNQTAYVGQDYNTNISVNTVLTDCVLPDELTKVISGNRELLKSEYTYTVSEDKLSATLYIPGKYIEGDVRIELTLVEPGPVIEYVDFTFTSESCSIKDKEGKDVTQVIKGETFEGKISLNQETTGMHLPSMLDITMGDVPVPLSDYEFNPYTGEFSIVPTGDIKISVEQDNSDAMFIYQYVAGGRNAFAFDIIPSSSECKIYWGDTDTPQIITAAGRYTHTYEVTTDGTRYTIKVSGVDSTSFENVMVVNYTGDQLVSAAYFDNAESDINEDGYGEPSLLEELYIGKKSYMGQSLIATNLHTIIVDESNERRSSSFDSNIVVQYNPDGGGVLKQGCSRSVIPDDKNIVDISPSAFMKSKIKEINIPASVTGMLNNPFKGADYLAKITVDPDSEYFTSRDQSENEHNMITTKKSTSYFEQNKMMVACNITTIPDDGTVKIIGEGAYNTLSSIKNIDIPDCVEQIDGAAIVNCPNLENINIQNSSNLTKFFHGTVEYIYLRNKGQLNGCTSLKSVIVPANVTHVAYDTGSTTYDFPLFDETNTALTEMIVLRAVPPILGGKKLFDSSKTPPNLTSIYVPDDSVNTYKGATGWSAYATMIKPLSERPTH